MNEENNFIKYKNQLISFPKKEIKVDINFKKNIFFPFIKINFPFTRKSQNNKITESNLKLCVIIILIFIIIILNYFVSGKLIVVSRIINRINKYNNNNKENALINKQYNFIKVTNEEGDSDSLVNIVIQNKIEYNPKVSLIIIGKNMQKYLDKFMEEIIKHNLKEIEMIFIDIGSKDDSLVILNHFAKIDKRITIIKQINLNVSFALNAGLTIAKGIYICFIDINRYFDLNMLNLLNEKILKEQSDIIICRYNIVEFKIGLNDKLKNNDTYGLDSIPKIQLFNGSDIQKKIFQFSDGSIHNKLFRNKFILSNNIKFSNIENYYDYPFTYIALCLSKSIETIELKIILKQNDNLKLTSKNKNIDPYCILSSINKIQSKLEKLKLYEFVKESFYEWRINFCITQLKYIDIYSRKYLFNLLHKKFNSWNYIGYSGMPSNRYKAFHYIKFQNEFPTINIVYVTNRKNINNFFISFTSILTNSEFETINLILLYNDLNDTVLQEINKLQEIHSFTLQTHFVLDEHFKDFTKEENQEKENGLTIKLILEFLYKLSNIEKILYLGCNTMIRKSLLSLWEVNINNKLIAAVEDLSVSKEKIVKINLKDNLYLKDDVMLLNMKEWRNQKLYNKIKIYIKKKSKTIDQSNQDLLNFFTDTKKIKLNKEFNYNEIFIDNTDKFDDKSLDLNEKNGPTIVNFFQNQINDNIPNNTYIKEFFAYYSLLNNLKDFYLTIPIVLYVNNQNLPFIYTIMISILENGNRNTYYTFYLLTPFNLTKTNKKQILELNNKYKCYIYIIYIQKILANMKGEKSYKNLYYYYYRLLLGDLIPKDIDKCIYLDVDTCANKDLSELFNIDMKDNYIAGVVSADYYFDEEKECKRLNISSMKQYVNSGMLLINLNKIRKDNVSQNFLKILKTSHNFTEQDILNVACYRKIITLPPKYNSMISILKDNNPLLRDLYREQEINEAKNSPFIIHYSDKNKPWNSINVYMEKYWWDIAKKTPYINTLFTRENIYKSKLKKFWFNIKKKILDIDRPISFNEKIQWIKLYDSTPIKTRLSDKYLVREWVGEKIGEEYLIPLYGAYDKFEDINFENLPNKFVIKCNHGSGFNIIVKNKSRLNLTKVKSTIEKWMNINYAFFGGLELQYRDIKHKIIIEKYLDDNTGDLRDYKITCFNGKPHFIWIDSDRHSNHKRNLYDLNWNQLPYKVNTRYSTFPSPKKPKCLEKLLELASILSKNFIYVRVDFYIINDKIYFGEMTFSSSSGTEDISPKYFEDELSSLIILPKIAYNIDSGQYYKLNK